MTGSGNSVKQGLQAGGTVEEERRKTKTGGEKGGDGRTDGRTETDRHKGIKGEVKTRDQAAM